MQQTNYQDNRNQLMMMGATIFVSITAAVILSTVIIMSLMRGEIAGALTSHVQNSSPTSQTASSCVDTSAAATTNAPAVATAAMPVATSAAAPLMQSAYSATYTTPPVSANHSFNSSNVSNTTTNNKITSTEIHHKTVIKVKDSFNDNSQNSHNPIIVKDNTVNLNSNNNTAVNSGNTTVVPTTITNNTTTTNTTTTTNSNNTVNTAVNSGNTTNSNNTVENHLLSDNVVIVPVI